MADQKFPSEQFFKAKLGFFGFSCEKCLLLCLFLFFPYHSESSGLTDMLHSVLEFKRGVSTCAINATEYTLAQFEPVKLIPMSLFPCAFKCSNLNVIWLYCCSALYSSV